MNAPIRAIAWRMLLWIVSHDRKLIEDLVGAVNASRAPLAERPDAGRTMVNP